MRVWVRAIAEMVVFVVTCVPTMFVLFASIFLLLFPLSVVDTIMRVRGKR